MLFSYSEAFERNIGLISEREQQLLRNKTVAIAGCGGVGSVHAHTLARIGVGNFVLADPDTYSVANFNRQIGANMSTVGENKAQVMKKLILSINPEANVRVTDGGVSNENICSFIEGSQLVVDGIDFFSITPRRLLFSAAWDAGLPALTAAPLGFSGALLVFDKPGMSFDEYFNIDDAQTYYDQIINFLIGLAPAALHLPYMDLKGVDPSTGRGPSSIVGVQMAACLLCAQAIKILLDRKGGFVAPEYVQFDAYRLKTKRGRLGKGNRGLVQKLKRKIVLNKFQDLGLDKAFDAIE